MLRLGSILLSALLTGVPRALDTRAFGAQRSVYVEVAPADPELSSFARELERALAAAAYTLVTERAQATLVVEVHGFARSAVARGRGRDTVLMTVGRGRARHPLVLDHAPGQRAQAARVLLEALSGTGPTAAAASARYGELAPGEGIG
jgi:hypothetical protein